MKKIIDKYLTEGNEKLLNKIAVITQKKKDAKVVITQKKTDAKYAGNISWVDDKKGLIKLNKLWILNKDYSMKVASKSNTERTFKLDGIDNIELFDDVKHKVKWQGQE